MPFDEIDVSISNNFKDLFERLVCYDPKERLSLNQIKMHSWINNDVYNNLFPECSVNQSSNSNLSKFEEEYLKEFNNRKNLIDAAMKE